MKQNAREAGESGQKSLANQVLLYTKGSLRDQPSTSQGFLLLIKISNEAVNDRLGKFKAIIFRQSSSFPIPNP